MEETRVIEVKEEILAENTAQADLFRVKLAGEGTYYIDIMSSPGAGKTTLLLALIERLRTDSEIGIIEADLESFVDSKKIKEAGMENRVIMLGKKDNPYPYIKACDLYVQPSRYEGKAVTVREAQMLGKPVVITRYATSSGQLEDGVDGVIVPMDNEGCAMGIAALLKNPEEMARLAENCGNRNFSKMNEAEKLWEIPLSQEN